MWGWSAGRCCKMSSTYSEKPHGCEGEGAVSSGRAWGAALSCHTPAANPCLASPSWKTGQEVARIPLLSSFVLWWTLENMLVMLGSGLLLKIDEEKAQSPRGCFVLWLCGRVQCPWGLCGLGLGTAHSLQTPPGLQAGHLSGWDLGFSSLLETR